MNKKKILIYALLTASMMIWGSTFVWTKIALNYYNPYTILCLRLFFSLIFLLPILLIFKKLTLPKRKDLHLFMLLSAFEPFLYFIGETNGIRFLSPSIASATIALIPLFTPFIARIFLKERISLLNIVGILISIVGILILVLSRGMELEVSHVGLLLMLLAICATNGYSVVVKKIPQEYSIFTVMFWQNLFGLIYFIPLFFIFSWGDISATGYVGEAFWAAIKLGIFGSTIAFLFYMYALRYMSITKVNVFSNSIPIFTMVVSFFVLGEVITVKKACGILVIVAGVLISQFRLKKASTTLPK